MANQDEALRSFQHKAWMAAHEYCQEVGLAPIPHELDYVVNEATIALPDGGRPIEARADDA